MRCEELSVIIKCASYECLIGILNCDLISYDVRITIPVCIHCASKACMP